MRASTAGGFLCGWLGFAPSAWACGGFFCDPPLADAVEPVAQSAERILFREDPDGWTTFVEVQFEGAPAAFGWVVPIGAPLDVDADVTTAPAGLFDALERATGPTFVAASEASAAAAYYGDAAASCEGPGCAPYAPIPVIPDTSGVDVVGRAVVGPYAIELISADDGGNLTSWLQLAGYAVPTAAGPILDDYAARGYAFLGIKLAPAVSAGPIDTLVLRCGATRPEIPLVLTSIAAVPDMDVLAYVLADRRYGPDAPWAEVGDVPGVRFDDAGDTDYRARLRDRIDALGGRAFRTESASPAADVVAALPDDVALALDHGAYLTRLRTVISPDEMVLDPAFVPAPEGAGDVSRAVIVDDGTTTTARSRGSRAATGWASLAALALGLQARRRRPRLATR